MRQLVVLILVALSGCGFVQRTALRSANPVLERVGARAERETDYDLAAQGIPGTILLIEGLLETSPNDATLRLLAARSIVGYALGFVEDENPQRGGQLHLRGRDHAFHVLDRRNKRFYEARTTGTIDEFREAVADFDSGDVEALFWAASGWGSWINLSLHVTDALADLPRVEILMARVLELDETYYFAGPHLFFGTYYSARSKMLGGDPDRGRHHFEKVFEFTDNRLLIAHVLYAQHYARLTWDEDLFVEELEWVISQPDDIYPESGLTNAIAKRRAARLLGMREEWF